jgi:hypothetical protein
MPQHSKEVVRQFEQQCIWIHQSWQTRKCLFDDKSNLPIFQQPHYEHFFLRLSYILQDYWMQQVAKLHDRARSFGQDNLTVDYIVECGCWDAATKARLSELREKMRPFAEKMRTPRNKLLAHNDLATILSATMRGAFDEGEDVEYFEHLETFAEIIVHQILDEHFHYDSAVPTDIALFVAAFDRGRIGGEYAP